MTILVTGGAGFIGSNFVLDWVAQTDESVVNLDALTYAGNLENLASLSGNPRHVFVKGSIDHFELVAKLLKTTDYYAPEHERCIRWDDPVIGIHHSPSSLRSRPSMRLALYLQMRSYSNEDRHCRHGLCRPIQRHPACATQ